MPYYNTIECAGAEQQHTHAECPGGRNAEFGRVRQSGFIKQGYLPTVLSGANSPSTWLQVWEDGIEEGSIIILPETSGSVDPGSPSELQGFGDRPSSNGPRTQVLTVNDPDYAQNYEFYNNLSKRTDLVPFYVTSSLIHIYDKSSTSYANNPVEDDLNSQVVWNFQATVISENLPKFWPVQPIAPAIKYTPTDQATTYDTIFRFAESTDQEGAGNTATAESTNANLQFQFNAITERTGTPMTMGIYVGNTQELTVTFPSDYNGKPFRFIDRNGVKRTGRFQDGDVRY